MRDKAAPTSEDLNGTSPERLDPGVRAGRRVRWEDIETVDDLLRESLEQYGMNMGTDSDEKIGYQKCKQLEQLIPPALVCTSLPRATKREAKAVRNLVLRARRVESASDFEKEWGVSPQQPLMPLVAEFERELVHRPKHMGAALLGLAPDGPLCNWAEAEEELTACIARRVYKKEIDAEPCAQAALQKERERLEAVPVWDLHNPVSWKEVSAEAIRNNTKAYIGDIMPLVYQKHSEIKGNDPLKIYKGRIVYRGDAIKDEFFEWSLFGEVASSPSAGSVQSGRPLGRASWPCCSVQQC